MPNFRGRDAGSFKVGMRDVKGAVGEIKFGCTRESGRNRYSDERVLPDGLTFISLRRYCVSEE